MQSTVKVMQLRPWKYYESKNIWRINCCW